MEDRNQFRLQVIAPEGTSYDYMDNLYRSVVAVCDGFYSGSYDTDLTVTAPGFSGAGAVNSGICSCSASSTLITANGHNNKLWTW